MNAMNCPIKVDLNKAIDLGGEYSKIMRKIRREIGICDTCTSRTDCEVRSRFDQAVDEVIAELNREWGLL